MHVLVVIQFVDD